MTDYTWVISRDKVSGETSDEIGRIGPRGASSRSSLATVVLEGSEFRLIDDAGDVRYTGYILGEFAGHEPLEDYGRRNGCTRIEYR